MKSSDGISPVATEMAAEELPTEVQPVTETDNPLHIAMGEGKSLNADGSYANGVDACSSDDDEGEEGEEGENTLERASDLFEKGIKAIKDEDFPEAVDCLSRALEIRVANFGELAPECATSYYKYGCALLYKAQEETDPLGNVPKNAQKNSIKDKSTNMEGGISEPYSELKTQHSSSKQYEIEEGSVSKNTEDENEGIEGVDEELEEADEDDSDLDLAWKMLDIARAIFEKNTENSIDKVNVYSALGEVSMEREDVESSLIDFSKALSILEHLVEPDNRRIVELNFRICLVLELGSKVEEAIPYCEKAISLCQTRIECLKEASNESKHTENGNKKSVSEPDSMGKELPSESSNQDSEIDLLISISTELEKKLEDLLQLKSNPKSTLTDLLKINASTLVSTVKNTPMQSSKSSSINSSQMAAIECSDFDSPTVSTAANGGVTHLGVVGRGIKRAVATPIGTEPSPKKSESEQTSEKTDSCVSEVLYNPQISESSSK